MKRLPRYLFGILVSIILVVPKGHTDDPAATMAEFCTKLPRPAYASLQRLNIEDDWFEVYRVAEGVTAIYEPYQWQEIISYLIEGEKKALLFDTGNGIADIQRVVKLITNKPVMVLNSHTHYDHVGGNYAFDNIVAMDTDFTRARQAGHTNEQIRIEVSPPALCKPLPAGVSEGNHIGRPFEVGQYIQDGHVFDLGQRSLRVIRLPGHTPDAIALIDSKAGLMWTGDSYYSGPIWLYAPETDLLAYKQSLQKMILESDGVKALLPAHNTPWVDPRVLKRVARGFDRLIAGELIGVPEGGGVVVYKVPSEDEFSFLLSEGMLD